MVIKAEFKGFELFADLQRKHWSLRGVVPKMLHELCRICRRNGSSVEVVTAEPHRLVFSPSSGTEVMSPLYNCYSSEEIHEALNGRFGTSKAAVRPLQKDFNSVPSDLRFGTGCPDERDAGISDGLTKLHRCR